MIEDDSPVYTTGRITQWKVSLAVGLAHHYGCAIFNNVSMATGRKVSNYKLVGKTSDIQIVRYMFTWLIAKCGQLSDMNAKGKGHIFVSSYCTGFTEGVLQQLKESRVSAQEEASSSAIVAINSRAKEADAFMRSNRKLVRSKGASSARFSAEGYAGGMTAGKSLHLGASLGPSKGRLLSN